MSHFTEIKVNFDQKFEKELIEALEEHFGEGGVEIHNDGEDLRTYSGRKNTEQSGLGRTEPCHLIIRKATQEKKAGHGIATNDAGYARQEDGQYKVFLDEAGYGKKLQGLVAQSYALRVAEKKFRAEGYMTKRVQKEDGVIRIEARQY